MCFRSEICQIIKQNVVVSQSGWSNQHQGLDAILEEVNKMLKTLIPPIPVQKHWEMAARNCTKFMEVRINVLLLFECIIHYFFIDKITFSSASESATKNIICCNRICGF